MNIVSPTEQQMAYKAMSVISEITPPSNPSGSYSPGGPNSLDYMTKTTPYMGRDMPAPFRQERMQLTIGKPSLEGQTKYLAMDLLKHNPKHMYN